MRLLTFLAFIVICDSNLKDFTTTNRLFSASVFKKISKYTTGNFLVSPLSAQTILALTEAGSKGKTAEELKSVLNFTNREELGGTIENVIDSFSNNRLIDCKLANKVYVKDDFSINPEFQNVASEIFKAKTETVDFSRKQQAVQTMNVWVQEQTNDKIRNLVSPEDVNDRTRLFLINALYFKANWSKPFLVAYTKSLDFHLSPTEKIKVDTMLLHEKIFNYYESKKLNAKFLELPFKDKNFSMVVVLPNELDGLSRLQSKMKKVLKIQPFTSESVNVGLPRFKVESSTDLKKVLQMMGVSKPFDERYADLSGIVGEKGDLIIDKINQKTFIDVTEEGVEGAAATYSLIAIPMSASPQPKTFIVDRPFIFYIKAKDVILFVGRVANPRNNN